MTFYKKNTGRSSNSTDSGSSHFGRGYSSQNKKTHHRSGKPKGRPVKTFDPSLFMKKVEEQGQTAAYIPKNTFSDFLIGDQLKSNILSKGYTMPTPIQDQVILFF